MDIDPQEVRNGEASRRLDCRADDKERDYTMHSMQGSAGEDEPLASTDLGASQDTPVKDYAWLIRVAVILWLFGLVVQILHDDSFKLHFLYYIVRSLRTVNIVLGNLALVTEKAYYDVVDSIPH